MKKMFRFGLVAMLLASILGISVATTSAQECSKVYRIVVVTHGQASDPFWSVVKNGVDAADADLPCVETEYQAPSSFDMVAMSQLIDAAVASDPDGLIVSNPDPDALGPSITAAIAAGVPVI